MASNTRSYWKSWLERARRGPLLEQLKALHPWGIAWGTLGVPRQYVTVIEGQIVSKSAGARYVRDKFGPRWHRILDEALRLRLGGRGLYPWSPFERRRDMLAFLEEAIERTLAASSSLREPS